MEDTCHDAYLKKKLGATLTVAATCLFLPVTAHAQTAPAQARAQATAVTGDASFIPPYEPDHYRQVDTSD
ncbi:hypothetical protein CEPID_02395 [Corynebacterium epidermidicanis]|uniref:Uncharacterized protein n=1 Tax=Corynebacterium epidermidicanis TaxID=1050174 RepID=A0A0G3GP71_9CORY|nr:hypothetical protein CEPID_02395 [Corynebacterium epidermidicanis]